MTEIILSEKPLIRLIHGDCMEFMAGCEAKQFDLAVVDPPYGKNPHRNQDGFGVAKRNYQSGSTNWDIKPGAEYWHDLFIISNNQIVWGANYFIENLHSSNSFIFWDKVKYFKDYADGELAWTSFNIAAKIFRFAWNGMIQGDMSNKEERIHPTQKPVALYKWLLSKYAKPNDTILDTHLGSASSAIAAYDMGFDFTGIELDKDYFDAAVKRVKRFISEPKIQFPSADEAKQSELF